jgi:hypothetical protein
MKTDHGCGCHAAAPVACSDGIAERPRYFARQLITPDDMTLEQDYFRNRMRRHNRLLHGWGVVCGALVCPVVKTDGSNATLPWKVVVQPGYILGPYGDEILIDCNVCFDLRTRCLTGVTGEACGESVDPWCSEVYVKPDTNAPLYVAVRYKSVMARPVRVQPMGCGCDDNQCEYSRWRDGYEICVLDHCSIDKDVPGVEVKPTGPVPACPDCPSEPWVVLAKVIVDEQGIVQTIDNCACRRLAVSWSRLWWKCNADAPVITPGKDVELRAGDKNVDIDIAGEHLAPDATVSFGNGIIVKNVTAPAKDGTALKVTVDVDDKARPGPRTIVVRNPDCSTATLAGKVKVTAPTPPAVAQPKSPRAKGPRPAPNP